MDANLVCLRAYQKRDPGCRRAIAEFIETEASLGDPLEGESIDGQFIEKQPEPAAPVQSRLRELLAT
jgi:hypothetical protein